MGVSRLGEGQICNISWSDEGVMKVRGVGWERGDAIIC